MRLCRRICRVDNGVRGTTYLGLSGRSPPQDMSAATPVPDPVEAESVAIARPVVASRYAEAQVLVAALACTPTASLDTCPDSPPHGGLKMPYEGGMGSHLLLLGVLLLLNTINFWDRNLLFSLAATSTPGCEQACMGAVWVPTCVECEGLVGGQGVEVWDGCERCRVCRIQHHSTYFNVRDGVCLSSTHYALLAGLGFTLAFSLFGLVAGYLADAYDRRMVHCTAIIVWSLATVCSGLSNGFPSLLVCRLVLGMAEAFNAPCCYALLTQHFGPQTASKGGVSLPLANGVYSMGTYIGAGLAALAMLVARSAGWRRAYFLPGTLGLVAALAYARLPTPPHRHTKSIGGGRGGGRQGAGGLGGRVCCVLVLASSVRMMGTATVAAYLPVLMQRRFLPQLQPFALTNALGYALCGSLSSALGGFLTATQGVQLLAWVPALGIGLALVFVCVVVMCPSFHVCMVALLCFYLLGECWLGPGMAILQREVGVEGQGQAVAVLLLLNNLTASLGPAIMGWMDDGTTTRAQVTFLAIMGTAYGGSALAFAALGLMLGAQGRHRQAASDEEEEAPLLRRETHTRTRQRDTFV